MFSKVEEYFNLIVDKIKYRINRKEIANLFITSISMLNSQQNEQIPEI